VVPYELTGRNAIITGASQGLGKEIARAYLAAGASVLICARSAADLERTQSDLQQGVANPSRVLAEVGDVSRAADAGRFVNVALMHWSHVDVLVNNAGVYGPLGPSDEVDWLEWTRAVEINLYGSVLPTRALLPHFKKRRYGKIVQISGGGATNPLPRITAYAASKAAVIRFAESLAEEVREFGIDVNAIAPGALNTRMMDQVIASGPETVGEAFYARMERIKAEGGTSLQRGADLAVFLGSAASDGLTGRLISAAWDPWETLASRVKEIAGTDIYTLRRITPADRGKNWDDR
jgi:NAD(P)-dependent dehydrogenase (short-subunit alcohol dehydrogenase family)